MVDAKSLHFLSMKLYSEQNINTCLRPPTFFFSSLKKRAPSHAMQEIKRTPVMIYHLNTSFHLF